MTMTGVRPGSRTVSRVAPGSEDSRARAQRSNRATASSIWPCAAQSGSKAGDLFGILMYSTNAGTISSSQHSIDVLARLGDVDHWQILVSRGRRCPAPAANCRPAAARLAGRRIVAPRPAPCGHSRCRQGCSGRARAVGDGDRRWRDRLRHLAVRRLADEIEHDVGDDADDHGIGKCDRLAKGQPHDPAARTDESAANHPSPQHRLAHGSPAPPIPPHQVIGS